MLVTLVGCAASGCEFTALFAQMLATATPDDGANLFADDGLMLSVAAQSGADTILALAWNFWVEHFAGAKVAFDDELELLDDIEFNWSPFSAAIQSHIDHIRRCLAGAVLTALPAFLPQAASLADVPAMSVPAR